MATSKYIQLTVEHNEMQCYTVLPEGQGPFPGIIVLQEAFGVNNHIRNIATRLAAQGYVAIAPELFHRTAAPGLELGSTDYPSVMPHIQAVTNEGLEADIKACFEWLQQQKEVKKDKIAAIGFCLGGQCALLANASLPLAASISFYGGNTASLLDKLQHAQAPQLMIWGGLDK